MQRWRHRRDLPAPSLQARGQRTAQGPDSRDQEAVRRIEPPAQDRLPGDQQGDVPRPKLRHQRRAAWQPALPTEERLPRRVHGPNGQPPGQGPAPGKPDRPGHLLPGSSALQPGPPDRRPQGSRTVAQAAAGPDPGSTGRPLVARAPQRSSSWTRNPSPRQAAPEVGQPQLAPIPGYPSGTGPSTARDRRGVLEAVLGRRRSRHEP